MKQKLKGLMWDILLTHAKTLRYFKLSSLAYWVLQTYPDLRLPSNILIGHFFTQHQNEFIRVKAGVYKYEPKSHEK